MARRPPPAELQWLDELLVDAAAAVSNQEREPRRRHPRLAPAAAAKPVGASPKHEPEASSPEMDAAAEGEGAGADGHETEDGARREMQQRCDQLRADVEVLAAHLESQAAAHGAERAALEQELGRARLESEALRGENERLAGQAASDARALETARETHAQLLRALTQQQAQGEQLQATNHVLTRDRATARRALEAAQLAARRLEEELAAAHAQLLRLQGETRALEAALAAAAARAVDGDAAQLRRKDERIGSLRADLLQMEFECSSLRVDKAALEQALAKATRAREASTRGGGGASSLASSSSLSSTSSSSLVQATADNDVVALAVAPGRKRATIRPLKARGDDGRGSVFGSLMDLPNAVSDRHEAADAPASHGRGQAGHGIVSRMATTVKKRFGGAALDQSR